jgi:hypothetical protein
MGGAACIVVYKAFSFSFFLIIFICVHRGLRLRAESFFPCPAGFSSTRQTSSGGLFPLHFRQQSWRRAGCCLPPPADYYAAMQGPVATGKGRARRYQAGEFARAKLRGLDLYRGV